MKKWRQFEILIGHNSIMRMAMVDPQSTSGRIDVYCGNMDKSNMSNDGCVVFKW